MAGHAQTIIELDRQRMTAMAEKNTAKLETLLADDLIYCHSSERTAYSTRFPAGHDVGIPGRRRYEQWVREEWKKFGQVEG